MRTLDRKDAIQHEADELASEAFDRQPLHIWQWIKDAFVGEWGDNAQSAAQEVLDAGLDIGTGRTMPEGLHRLRRAVEALREEYVEYSSIHGLYAAEAEDAINCAASDEAERQRDLQDDRAVDAYQAGVRG